MTARLNEQFASSLKQGGQFPSDILAFRNALAGIHTFPYARGALLAVNLIRFAPVALAVISYLTR